MKDFISELPDDILCYILSLLSLRDAVRARTLSARWRYLLRNGCDVLQLDASNVFGDEYCNTFSYHSRFVRAVDQSLEEAQRGPNLSVLSICFGLGNKYRSHIDRWILHVVSMEIKELNLQFWHITDPHPWSSLDSRYVLYCPQLCHLMTSSLRCLHLTYCDISISSGRMSWISHLTSLHLSAIPMNQDDIEFVLSSCSNLTFLSLSHCALRTGPRIFRVRHFGLKKLVIHDTLREIELTCPNLDIFEYKGRAAKMIFGNLPILRQVILSFLGCLHGCSLIFADLIKSAPNLKALHLWVTTEVQPPPLPLPLTIIGSCLKQLDIVAFVPMGFGLCTLIHFLNASPSLEIFHLEMKRRSDFTKERPQKEYPDCLHFQLKQVIFQRLSLQPNELDFARYILRNAIALEQMVIVHRGRHKENIAALLQNINATAELIIL